MSFELYQKVPAGDSRKQPPIITVRKTFASCNLAAGNLIKAKLGASFNLYIDRDTKQVGFGAVMNKATAVTVPKSGSGVIRGIKQACQEVGIPEGSYILEESSLAPVALRIRKS